MRDAAKSPVTARLFADVDIASLAAFRIAFGALMLVELWMLAPDIAAVYLEPGFHFTYYGLEWVRPWPGDGMYVHFAVLALAALGVAVGLFYRISALLFFLGIAYIFLLEQGTYLNHVYLITLLSFLMIFVPAQRAWSVDAWLRPRIRAQTAPGWALWLLRAQVGIPYFYAGLAKLNPDWLRGEPVRMWLAESTDAPLIGPLLTHEWVVYTFAYGGLLFDLLVVPALLWPRTRPFAYLFALAFHLTNATVFSIGIFPWLMIAATTIFFEPGWPRALRDRLARLFDGPPRPRPALAPAPARLRPRQRVIVALLVLYVGGQLLFPLRHWLYPGDVNWTEEGHKFSWRMKLRDKDGSVRFFAVDRVTGEVQPLDARRWLRSWQREEMCGRPEMILQFARFLGETVRSDDGGAPEIRVVARISLNGRPPRLLIDPSVDLAAARPSLWPAPWIRRDPGRLRAAD